MCQFEWFFGISNFDGYFILFVHRSISIQRSWLFVHHSVPIPLFIFKSFKMNYVNIEFNKFNCLIAIKHNKQMDVETI